MSPSLPVEEAVNASAQLASALAQMTQVLLGAQSGDAVVDLVLDLAVQTLPDTVGAGVTIVDDDGKHTRAASNALVEEADQLQYLFDSGPCLSAWRDQVPVRVDAISAETRWPEWTEAVGVLGVRSMLSVPMLSTDRSMGAIKVYSDQPGAYDDSSVKTLELFAKQASILLSNTQAVADARQLSVKLTEVLRERDETNQAAGILLAQGATDVPAAFKALRQAAQRAGVPLHAMAQGLLEAAGTRNRSGLS